MKNHHHQSSHPPRASERIHEAIATRAYGIWCDRGRPDNQSDEIWLEAEKKYLEDQQQGSDTPNSGS
ncbi:MAG TPA: DUF2934 domain-containing protein [Bryobacteraceae bacterium]|nr:DUF2934 domain-containing protein [Bryobacteraceae bacterium]